MKYSSLFGGHKLHGDIEVDMGQGVGVDSSHQVVKVVAREKCVHGEQDSVVWKTVKSLQFLEVNVYSILLIDDWEQELVQAFTWAGTRNDVTAQDKGSFAGPLFILSSYFVCIHCSNFNNCQTFKYVCILT